MSFRFGVTSRKSADGKTVHNFDLEVDGFEELDNIFA